MLDREQSRAFDRLAISEFGIPGVVLMENAGRGAAEALLAVSRLSGCDQPNVVILSGGGNNGGDGFVIARHLVNAGCRVKVLLFSDAMSYRGDAAVMLRPLLRLPIGLIEVGDTHEESELEQLLGHVHRHQTDWVVDALVGTGARGPLRSPLDRGVAAANAGAFRRMAVDIPSGLDCDTGQPGPVAFIADLTCTFVDQKPCMQQPDARRWLGQVTVVEIGLARHLVPQTS